MNPHCQSNRKLSPTDAKCGKSKFVGKNRRRKGNENRNPVRLHPSGHVHQPARQALQPAEISDGGPKELLILLEAPAVSCPMYGSNRGLLPQPERRCSLAEHIYHTDGV